MSRQDITKSVQIQMMRATDVGQPPLDGIMGQVADAVKRWEIRRGIRPVESWFEAHRKKRQGEAVASPVKIQPAKKAGTKRDPKKVEEYRKRSREKAQVQRAARASEVLANGTANRWSLARTRIEEARRRGGDAAAELERKKLLAETKERQAKKIKAAA